MRILIEYNKNEALAAQELPRLIASLQLKFGVNIDIVQKVVRHYTPLDQGETINLMRAKVKDIINDVGEGDFCSDLASADHLIKRLDDIITERI